MNGPQSQRLPGDRLHLHHGPIDLVIGANQAARAAAFALAAARFDGLLEELVAELPALRRPTGEAVLKGPVARAMAKATRPFRPAFVTPMAAVAGAVADAVLETMARAPGLSRAYVNNGGDVALFLAPGETMAAAMAGGRIALSGDDPWRGVATSGRGGRSQSLGIADAVSVVARTAARADAAATMIANAVDLPGHPAVRRRPACEIAPDSDLGARPVTVGLGPLAAEDAALALDRGVGLAETLRARGLIGGAHLSLRGQHRTVDPAAAIRQREDAENA
ncbi:ApbE superfamily uncharacterized protein (UPF0280 family) [Rhodovulum iodosum]|uniref:ApbE superfamily uncharacterized protein (UPF0280 family) n=1 Tax=Rhodovulum iodosum TaxID=68291 RepID=A0ABV3XUQ8_9RHOB|nr:UPF0280 family protein [Rhodovulum robiginosum]RSK35121.1 UPF0280 family protein [Rhodovulum robiginosum]